MEKPRISSQIVEKILVNLRVISQLGEGDKLQFTANGHFVPLKPVYWTPLYRFVHRIDRWTTLSRVQETVNSAEIMENHGDGVDQKRIEAALKASIHGLRNLQLTYHDDVLFYQSIEVLLERIASRYELHGEDML